MGRKERKGFEYFNMEVDAGQDPKMFLLMRLGGCSAVCCWFFLLMETYKKGGCLQWGAVEVEWFAARYSLTIEQVNAGIKALCDAQLISKRVLGLGYITSRGIQIRAAEIAAKLKRGTPSFPQGTELTEDEDDSPLALSLPDQSKQKETRLDCTRLKGIANNPEESGRFANIPEESGRFANIPEESRNMSTLCTHNAEGSRDMPNIPEESQKEPFAIAQAPAPKKAKAQARSIEGKTLYGKNVWLSQIELEQFEVTHGPEFTQACIEKLDAWIDSDPTPRRIKNGRNAGACFRSWVINAVSEAQSRSENAKRGKNGFRPHTAATTVEKNEQYLKERYGQEYFDKMLATPLFSEEELDFKPASGGGLALLPKGVGK